MIRFTQGNLLDSGAEALVNTVNTHGVMGKGIALMFKEAFPENYFAYRAACKRGDVKVGRVFVTERTSLIGPKWIINFPTKQHWRNPSKIEWIASGLEDLKRVIIENNITSIAIPPLGSGNGGLDWEDVKPMINNAFAGLSDLDVIIYEPTRQYQNVAKRNGKEELTPARALIAELVRRYSVLGIDCSILEVQKLAYFLERVIERMTAENPLKLQFHANKFGPYANRLMHLLDALDGSYLHCDRRIADASPFEPIRFDDAMKDKVHAYLTTEEAKVFRNALEVTADIIDGFESPLGMELLATVDWLLHRHGIAANRSAIKQALEEWPGGAEAAERKMKLFNDRLLDIAIERLSRLNV